MSGRHGGGSPPGFTLLEVMVALAIAAAALMAISDLSSSALRNHVYARQLSQATLLARGKMAQLEEVYEDKGFKDFDESEEGDFAEEGHPDIKWHVELKKPEADLSAEQLLGYLTGASGGDAQDVMAKLMGTGGQAKDQEGPQTVPGQGLAGAAMSGLLQRQMTTFGEQIKKSLRELRLTVGWNDGRQKRQFTVVTHLVVLNPRAPGGTRGENPDVPPGLTAPQPQQQPQQQQNPQTDGKDNPKPQPQSKS